jgi:hypothetical protein
MADNPDESMIPRSRLNEEIAKYKKAQAELTALQGEYNELGRRLVGHEEMSKQGQEYKKALDMVTAELQKEKAMRVEDGVLYKAGVSDPKAIGYLRYMHAQEGGEQSFTDYIEAEKASPDSFLNRFVAPPAPPAEQPAAQTEVTLQSTLGNPDQAPPAEPPTNGQVQPPVMPPRAPSVTTGPPSSGLDPMSIARLDLKKPEDYATFQEIIAGKA